MQTWFEELEVAEPFPTECGGSWVAPATRPDGTRAVLKIDDGHMEARDEAAGLRFWDGDPTVRLLECDADSHAMLLERCEPGASLRELAEPEQDVVITGLLQRLWRRPNPGAFRPLVEMIDLWATEASDAGIAALLRELARTSDDDVLLATDLHAGNVLRDQREPWLVIDPKPFVGDRAYDATQHLLNCQRLDTDALTTIDRFADRLEVDRDRVRRWTYARAASGMNRPEVARALASCV
jgi:streptomycin 6-kinase